MTYSDWKTQEWRRIRDDLRHWIEGFDNTNPETMDPMALYAYARCADDLEKILDGSYERG